VLGSTTTYAGVVRKLIVSSENLIYIFSSSQESEEFGSGAIPWLSGSSSLKKMIERF
jgi:hypothetical protein